jgi:hypothetical protein
VSGFGDVTGLQYVATGASRTDFPSFPSDPIIPLDLAFSLVPNGPPTSPPSPIIPLDISFLITFSIETQQWSVEILSASVPGPSPGD